MKNDLTSQPAYTGLFGSSKAVPILKMDFDQHTEGNLHTTNSFH